MVNHTNMYSYLGMTINYNTKVELVFTMFDYIQDALDKSPEESNGQAETLADNHLLDVEKNIDKLNKEDGSLFRHLVAKLLYLSKIARPYIQTYVSFLCTWVRERYIYYWKKLQQTIRYLEATSWLPLTLEADGTMIIKWWLDASYWMHEEFQGHTGGTISLGKRHPYSTYSKHKINTKSSTEFN